MSRLPSASAGAAPSSAIARSLSRVENQAKEPSSFESIPEKLVTAKILSDAGIGPDYVAVRIQRDEFTDFRNGTVTGHDQCVADVLDRYSTQAPVERDAGELARSENRDALNVFLVPPDRANDLSGSPAEGYARKGPRSWVRFALKDALALDAKVYRDVSAVMGSAFLLTFPKGTEIPVDILPTDGRAPLLRQ